MSRIKQLSPEVQNQLSEITDILFQAEGKPKRKIFVMLMGFTHSGKDTLVGSHPMLQSFFKVHTDEIHVLLNERLSFLQDDDTVEGDAYWIRQDLTETVRRKLLEKAVKNGLAVLNDSSNLRQTDREARLDIADQYGYETVIIWVQCEEQELLRRLMQADKEKRQRGEEPTWVNLYLKVQKERFEAPEENETDRLIIHRSGVDDPNNIII